MAVDADTSAGELTPSAPQWSGVRPRLRLVILASAVVVAVIGCEAGWLGWTAYRAEHAQEQRNSFVNTARQTALNLTTISYTHADTDVQRILDGATGGFRDEFSQRSKPFIDAVKQARSTTTGSIVDAGLVSVRGDQADVLVAVTVSTSIDGAPDAAPKAWRMKITVDNTDHSLKASAVEFVP
ncbi:mammalian cell entry protein [Mycolicibacterium sphagni]|uniref:mammalian cell entry protein n=1 Tax=Mycolicibacterium sphagni TaxID=1786 RepID=UPI0021F2AFE8|nr:mammalian cell entry protein [Mycolicibacterium sphagni]MCV7177062.1 mammalian cell entry protein [Mycolicibacterium sphagni]